MAITYNNKRAMNEGFLNANVYRVTGGGVTFTTISTAGNVDLFTDTAVVNDALYFKVGQQCNKFLGIEFDITTAIVAVAHTLAFEYRKEDGTWAALPGLVDNTAQFTVTGVNSITWTMPTDWGTNATAVNGLTGQLWMRIRLSAVTTLTEGGRQANTTFKVYDNAVRLDSNHEYDSGTATSGTTTTLINTGKAYTVNELLGRSLYIHTGTGNGVRQYRIKSNTATVITIYDTFETTPDNTSQYAIGANYRDLLDVAVTNSVGVKTGSHSGTFNCYVDFKAGAFGDFNALIEFENDTYFYGTEANTNRYRHYQGYRLPLIYGLEKAVWGNTVISNRESAVDSRLFGWGSIATNDYTYLAGNKFSLVHNYPLLSTVSFIRAWMLSGGAYDIGQRYEGWRSTTFPKTATPKTEVRNLEVCGGHSGVENPNANFANVKTFFNGTLALFVTGNNNFTFKDFEFGLNGVEGGINNIYGAMIQFYAYVGTLTKYVGRKGILARPLNDSFLANSNGISYPQNVVRIKFTDEKNNPLQNVKVVGINGLGTELFNVLSQGVAGFLGSQTVTSGGSYSLTTQPTAATRLRFTVSGFTDVSSGVGANARIIIYGTDENGTSIEELLMLENVGNGEYVTQNEFLTVTASGLVTAGWTGTMTVDMGGMIYPQTFDVEKWQSTDDINLTAESYNPITFKIQKSGFEPLTITSQILRDQDWSLVLKRSELVIE